MAPSFIAEFPLMDFAAMKSALLKLGFADAQETAIGATIVKTEYEKMIASGKHDVIISSCCHSVNALIQKYYPSVLPYLADVLSPMLAHCRVIKEENPGACAVFIGPCISKKEEAELYGECDVALTYEELEAWMNEAGVVPAGDSTDRMRESAAASSPSRAASSKACTPKTLVSLIWPWTAYRTASPPSRRSNPVR